MISELFTERPKQRISRRSSEAYRLLSSQEAKSDDHGRRGTG